MTVPKKKFIETSLNKQKKNTNTNNYDKGNWEFNFFQKKEDLINESKIKISMKLYNSFNPSVIYQYMDDNLSKEEIIMIKKQKGEILKSSELIIYNNYINKQKENLKSDLLNIEKYGLAAKPITKEGKLRLLLTTLEYQLKKNNYELIGYIYLRLLDEKFIITKEIQNDFFSQLDLMNKVIKEIDLIELQFTKLYNQMPPLNNIGFKKLDCWQKQVINNIDNNISTLIHAPTSTGKSVLSSYTTTKGKILFVVPTDALTWQISSYLEQIINSNVPIVTQTYQSSPSRDSMINLLNNAFAIVGTADIIIDWLPFVKTDFKWIIFDEIHMIGRPEGSAMEYIIKLLPNIPFLALSATIANSDDLLNWFIKVTNQPIQQVIYNKRFFNLQKYYYDYNKDKLEIIHPLALIDEEQLLNTNLSDIHLQPTPPDIWNLAQQLNTYFELGNLHPNTYFDNKVIELNETLEYFNKLLQFITEKYKTDKNIILDIINNYKNINVDSMNINLVKLAFTIKNNKKTPVIIFQKNSDSCLMIAKKFAIDIEEEEKRKYPKLFLERQKYNKIFEKSIKKKVDEPDYNSKKALKLMLQEEDTHSNINYTNLQEPHEDFIFNNIQCFNEKMIEEWVSELHKYFPNTGFEYHYIIKLLWRGVGIYSQGLPDPYLRIVQTLATQKQLGIVFSDKSLIFGISMPFRSVILLKEINEELPDAMLFHQMCGRAGRRGLDKEGNVIFAGYSWDEIKLMSTNLIPIITGSNKVPYTIIHGNKIAEINNIKLAWSNIHKNYLNQLLNEHELLKIKENITEKFINLWNSGSVECDLNHLHLNWKLRHTNDGLIISYLLPYLKQAFEYKDYSVELNQIDIAHCLCYFLFTTETRDKHTILECPKILLNEPYKNIFDQLDKLNINIDYNIDNKLYLSIKNNKLLDNITNRELSELRHRLLMFGELVKNIQHYCFHSKIINLTKLLGKLLTRIWWIYHLSSPLID